MSKKIPGYDVKDDGTLVKEKRTIPLEIDTEVTLDQLLKYGLTGILRTLKAFLNETSQGINGAPPGMPKRDSVMNLKDCMSMIHELKKKEQDLLDSLSDEELDNYIKGNQK